MIFSGFMISGCDITDDNDSPIVFEYNFHESEHNFEAFFTDYPVGDDENMELIADYRPLPQPLDTTEMAHFISAVNRSDDVKMLYRKQVDGLASRTSYSASFEVYFATETPSGCVDIGGPPGEAVRVIAGADELKPERFVDQEDDYYRLNLQHHDNPSEWYNNKIMGDIANSRECEEGWEFEMKEVTSGPQHITFTSDDDGRAWIWFGTRSGFEGQTILFYTYFKAEFSPE
ncbi:MAG: hypothetical protein JJU13_05550 [Balneolaceae bacterium]|nr:hypothetical protein [Balneolaceae bacterium]